jgi:hypothetical protein
MKAERVDGEIFVAKKKEKKEENYKSDSSNNQQFLAKIHKKEF